VYMTAVYGRAVIRPCARVMDAPCPRPLHGGVHGPYTVVVMYCVRVRAMNVDGCVNEVRPRPKLKPRPKRDAMAEAKVIVTRPRLAVFLYNSGSTDLLGQRDLLSSFETVNYLTLQ